MSIRQINHLPDLWRKTKLIGNSDKQIELLGTIIDASFDSGDIESLSHALEYADEIEQKNTLSSQQKLTLYYFISNAWGDKYTLTNWPTKDVWSWEQKEFEKQLVFLRKALNEEAFNEVEPARRCQILTNLANDLDFVGRSVEAFEFWDSALRMLPNFGMAKANYAKGLFQYGTAIHKRHDAIIIFNKAHECLKQAIEMPGIDPQSLVHFKAYLRQMDKTSVRFSAEKHRFQNHRGFGKSIKEIYYRQWVVQNRLFLNHLNDLGETLAEAAFDNLILPPITKPIEERSSHFEGLLNQIKQEFVSARYIYFEGITSDRVHFSDKKVALYDTLDYPSYSIAVEKIKIAFRLAYSILDKIAYFLNEYLNLQIRQNQVTFKTFWYKNRDRQKGLRDEFSDKENWGLRGLFWVSKDLYENSEAFRNAIEPIGRELAEIRNHLEHKYLKVHEFGPLSEEFREDSLAYAIGRVELAETSLKILKLARSAIIYLTIAVGKEEDDRMADLSPDEMIGEIFMDMLADDSKI